ncbi:MAG TPA: hypothetical protein VKE69_13380 [Planctomycetota bacterium]|nr:hypothetical protein [Planctomycetota bacterium]
MQLLCGALWRGEDNFNPPYRGSSIHVPPGGNPASLLVLAENVLPPGTRRQATIAAAVLPEGESAIELVARAPDDVSVILGRSETLVLRRDGDRLGVVRRRDTTWPRLDLTVVLSYLAAAALVLALRRAPLPRLRARWLAAGLPAAALGALIAWRASAPTPTQMNVDANVSDPPLVWPLAWSLRGDALERGLGPGYRTLVDAARAERRAGEPLSLVIPEAEGVAFLRAAYAAAEFRDTIIHCDRDAYPPGLALFFDFDPGTEPIARTEAGVLARTPGRRREPPR